MRRMHHHFEIVARKRTIDADHALFISRRPHVLNQLDRAPRRLVDAKFSKGLEAVRESFEKPTIVVADSDVASKVVLKALYELDISH